jgi:hypothetical protein
VKSFLDYLAESEYRVSNPVEGDDFVFEFDDGTAVETYILEASADEILVDATEETWAVMEQWLGFADMLSEGVQCEAELEEDQDAAVVAQKEIDDEITDHANLDEGQVKQQMHTDAERMSRDDFMELYGNESWVGEFWDNINGELSEAEYQGRKVPLGKPMRGDVKKFKVYVRDPKTGNVKKVNFGHGGTSAKRLGQKTMKIKKSNPARRKSFRARHNCANPGPRTKARYWSCRAW